MKITRQSLRRLLREAIGDDKILPERPWTVEVQFKLSGGIASDSEGKGPDGFALNLDSSSKRMRVVVDTYWNPQAGEKSGNSLRVEKDGSLVEGGETYVPTRFDDGKRQLLIVSNSPVANVLTISHSSSVKDVPITYLVVKNPFDVSEDINFDIEPLGNGAVDAKITRHLNL